MSDDENEDHPGVRRSDSWQGEILRPDLTDVPDQDIIRELIRRMSGGQEDVNRPGLIDTPRRVVKSWAEMFYGYENPDDAGWLKAQLKEFEEPRADEMVVVRGVRVYSFCEHHLLPFFGTAAVGYIPGGGKVVGLSKLSRLVQYRMARLSTQERITNTVVEDLMTNLTECRGAACVISAHHLCMCARGTSEPEAVTVTSSLRGVLRTDPQARSEFLQLAGY